MKKQIIAIISIIIIFIITFLIISIKINNKYFEKYSAYFDYGYNGVPFIDFCVEVPNSINDIFDDIDESWQRESTGMILKDNLSRNSDTLLRYYPLYNRKTNKREGYILLSAGIDGKIDNIIEDTLFFDNFNEKLLLYNFKFIDSNSLFYENPKFNIFDYLFGRKDLLVAYEYCFEQYARYVNKFNGKQQTDIYIDYIEGKRKTSLRSITNIDGLLIKDSINTQNNERILYLKSFKKTNIHFKCSMFYLYENIELSIGDTIVLIGNTSYVDKEERLVHFYNCIFDIISPF